MIGFWLSYPIFLIWQGRNPLKKISLVLREIWRHQKDILKLTDLYEGRHCAVKLGHKKRGPWMGAICHCVPGRKTCEILYLPFFHWENRKLYKKESHRLKLRLRESKIEKVFLWSFNDGSNKGLNYGLLSFRYS